MPFASGNPRQQIAGQVRLRTAMRRLLLKGQNLTENVETEDDELR